MDRHNPIDSESEKTRIAITLGIVATPIALFSTKNFSAWSIVMATLALSGFMAFLYILFTATTFKYKNRNQIGLIMLPEAIRRKLYDYAIDIYGYNLVLILVSGLQYIISDGKNGNIFDASLKVQLVGLVIAIMLIMFLHIVRGFEDGVFGKKANK